MEEEELSKLRKSKERLLRLIKQKAPKIYDQLPKFGPNGGNKIVGGLNMIQKAGNTYNQNFSLIKDSLHLIPSREMIDNIELNDVLTSANNIINSMKHFN
jgi:hypothetical protein